MLVRKDDATNLMLDDNSGAGKLMSETKTKLTHLMHMDKPILEAFEEMFGTRPSRAAVQRLMK